KRRNWTMPNFSTSWLVVIGFFSLLLDSLDFHRYIPGIGLRRQEILSTSCEFFHPRSQACSWRASYPLGPAIPLHPPQHGVEPRETAALCKLLGLVLVV